MAVPLGHRLSNLLMTSCVLALSACATEEAGNSSPLEVRDSAGIEIVTNLRSASEAREEWRIAVEPTLSIGVQDGEEPYQLFFVSGGIRLSGGRIVIGNGGTDELREFDSEGQFLRAVGGNGDGPGEFRSLSALYSHVGDSIVAWDSRHRRFSIYDNELNFIRVANAESGFQNRPQMYAPLSSGEFVVSDNSFSVGAFREWREQSIRFIRFSSEGKTADTIGVLPRGSMARVGEEGYGLVVGITFQPETVGIVSGGRLYIGGQEAAEVDEYGEGGQILRKVRWTAANRKVPTEDIERYWEERITDSGSEEGQRINRLIQAQTPSASHYPEYKALLGDQAGNLWVQDWMPTWYEGPIGWTVFDSDGVMLARCTIPGSSEILEIGEDYLLVVELDDFDVERVKLYPLEKEQITSQ